MENNLENLDHWRFAKAAGGPTRQSAISISKGLLRKSGQVYGSIRRYGEADVVRVKFREIGIVAGVQSGRLLSCCGSTMAPTARRPAARRNHKLKDVREKMADLARWKPCCLNSCACHARKWECFLPVDRVTTGRSRPRKVSYALACFIFRFLEVPQYVC